MYKITLFFKSNVEGVYTKEEETATDYDQLRIKHTRMLCRWFKILCPHINVDEIFNNTVKIKKNYKTPTFKDDALLKERIMFKLIEQTLELMDEIDAKYTGIETTPETKRQFTITMTGEF